MEHLTQYRTVQQKLPRRRRHRRKLASAPPIAQADFMRLVIAGGGTGGHLFPGIAVAEQVRAPRIP